MRYIAALCEATRKSRSASGASPRDVKSDAGVPRWPSSAAAISQPRHVKALARGARARVIVRGVSAKRTRPGHYRRRPHTVPVPTEEPAHEHVSSWPCRGADVLQGLLIANPPCAA
jgi:hypothetical protein